MRVLPVSPRAIREAASVLRSGGIVIHPTETCYGIACDLTNPEAVARLFAVKQRPADQPVSALFSSVEHARKFVEWPALAERLAVKHLPGPLTLVLPLKSNRLGQLYPVPSTNYQRPVRPGHPGGQTTNSLGVRLSSHPTAQALMKAFGKPLSTTSANLHGEPNPYSVEDIFKQFQDDALGPDLILDGGTLPFQPPSTVVEITGKKWKILRKGSTLID